MRMEVLPIWARSTERNIPVIKRPQMASGTGRTGKQVDSMAENKNKEALRKEMREQRDRLSAEEIRKLTEGCLSQLNTMTEFQESTWVYSYMAIGSEVDTIYIIPEIMKMGKRVAVPKVEGETIAFYEITSIKDCKPGAWGILEPVSYKAPAQEKGLILIPGLAFDQKGNRLGYGGGFYDRYLQQHQDCTSVALAYEMQLMDEVPGEAHDQQVEYIVTPDRIIPGKQR